MGAGLDFQAGPLLGQELLCVQLLAVRAVRLACPRDVVATHTPQSISQWCCQKPPDFSTITGFVKCHDVCIKVLGCFRYVNAE